MPSAWAQASNTSDCSYADAQEVSTYGTYQNVVVYADRGAGGGSSGEADLSAGACVDLEGSATLFGGRVDGGTVEAGAAPDEAEGYAIADGDNDNASLIGTYSSQGYVGVSNFESNPDPEAKEGCDPGEYGSGENSGGCVTSDANLANLPVPLVACDHAPGAQWQNSLRDGCKVGLPSFGAQL